MTHPSQIDKAFGQKESEQTRKPKETIDWKWEISGLKDSLDFLKMEIHNLNETMKELKEALDENKS